MLLFGRRLFSIRDLGLLQNAFQGKLYCWFIMKLKPLCS